MLPNSHRLAIRQGIHYVAFEECDLPLDGLLVAGDITVGLIQQQVLFRLVELEVVMIQGNKEQRIARMEAGTIRMPHGVRRNDLV